jgi:outer membrane protein TolC
LPSVSLSLSGSLASDVLLDLANPTRAVSVALSLAQNLFDGGRLRLQTESARSQRAVQIITYAQTVRTALKEVDDGLGNAEKTARQEAAQQAVLDQAQRTLHLAELRYREGAGDLLAVLEAQRTVYSARDQWVTLRLSRLQAAVDLCKALGGGWREAAEK